MAGASFFLDPMWGVKIEPPDGTPQIGIINTPAKLENGFIPLPSVFSGSSS